MKTSSENLQALTQLLGKADVHLLSYAQSGKRENKVMQDMWRLPQRDRITAMETCWKKWGEGGKCHIAWSIGAMAIFDDDPGIIKECLDWGLEVYPIRTPRQSHSYLGKGICSYDTFADAVKAFKQNHPEL